MTTKTYTDKELLDKLQKFASEIDKTPSQLDFNKYNRSYLPSYQLYIKRFGKYSLACEMAGLKPNRSLRMEYKPESDYEMLQKLRSFIKDIKVIPSVREISKNPNLPHARTYIMRFKTWDNVIEATGLKRQYPTGRYSQSVLTYLLKYYTFQKQNILDTSQIINKIEDLPPYQIYIKYFGNIYNAYKEIEIKKEQINYFKIIDELLKRKNILSDFLEKFDDVKNWLKSSIASFDKREKDILKRRYGLGVNNCETLQLIANDYDLSRERIRQIQYSILRKLKHHSKLNKLKKIIDKNNYESDIKLKKREKIFKETIENKKSNSIIKFMQIGNGGGVKNLKKDKLQEIVEEEGVEKIANIIGVNKATIKTWLCGKHQPSIKFVKKMIKRIDNKKKYKLLRLEE